MTNSTQKDLLRYLFDKMSPADIQECINECSPELKISATPNRIKLDAMIVDNYTCRELCKMIDKYYGLSTLLNVGIDNGSFENMEVLNAINIYDLIDTAIELDLATPNDIVNHMDVRLDVQQVTEWLHKQSDIVIGKVIRGGNKCL